MVESNRSLRILLCDDHAIVRSGLAKILGEEDWIYVISEAENGEDLIRKYEDFRPELILTDISMPILSGFGAIKQIKKKYPDVKVLFISVYHDEQYIYTALKIGALGLVSKNISKDELFYAIKEVSAGRKYFGPLYDESKINALIKKYEGNQNSPPDMLGLNLSTREADVLECVSKGMMSQEIAETLNLGKRTVDKIRTDIMQKFKLDSLPRFISFAIHYTQTKKNGNMEVSEFSSTI